MPGRVTGASAAPKRTSARRRHAGWPTRRRRSAAASSASRSAHSPICDTGSRCSIAAPPGSGLRRSGSWTQASASPTATRSWCSRAPRPCSRGGRLKRSSNIAAVTPRYERSASVGSSFDPDAFQTARCEHCGVRRRRSTTFVVVHVDSGELRQVGSNCVRDFLGGNDPDRACRQAEYLACARAELKSAEVVARQPQSGLEVFAAHASHVVRAHGFISRAQARRESRPASADLALRSLQVTPNAPDAADQALAAGALHWAQALPLLKPNLSRFESDALAVIDSGAARTSRDRGLICALIAAYRQRRARSCHLAEPGQRLETIVLVEQARPVPSRRLRHRATLRADRRGCEPARVVADPRGAAANGAGCAPRRNRRASQPVRSQRGDRGQPLRVRAGRREQ